ncbi:carbohydrate-binding module family 21 [Fusarium austroafricanum]|uniref:Carbohydrate-binding module family 21 n=1 Tax=Fusarium austroafricanum TaxID=2364996 RepID=A0A8H4JHT3_9HYPO|nr:carbohydrate-binding module family 21 [Fusarium austroafricanum]
MEASSLLNGLEALVKLSINVLSRFLEDDRDGKNVTYDSESLSKELDDYERLIETTRALLQSDYSKSILDKLQEQLLLEFPLQSKNTAFILEALVLSRTKIASALDSYKRVIQQGDHGQKNPETSERSGLELALSHPGFTLQRTQQNRFPCIVAEKYPDYCKKSFVSIKKLLEHLKRCHSPLFWCKDCHQKFNSSLSDHALNLTRADHENACSKNPTKKNQKLWEQSYIIDDDQYKRLKTPGWKQTNVPRKLSDDGTKESVSRRSWRQIRETVFPTEPRELIPTFETEERRPMFLFQFDGHSHVPTQQELDPITEWNPASSVLSDYQPSDLIRLEDQYTSDDDVKPESGTDPVHRESFDFDPEATDPPTFMENDHMNAQYMREQKISEQESTISSIDATHPPTIWSTREGSTHPSSLPQESEDQQSAARSTLTFLNYQKPETDNQVVNSSNDFQSVISLSDDIGSLAEGADEMTNIRHTAVAYLVNALAEDSDLSTLYKEATQKLHQARFIENHRRLLKQYYLKLREEGQGSTQLSAVEFLRPRQVRILVSQGIWHCVTDTDNAQLESFSLALEQNKDDMLMLDRFLAEMGREPSDLAIDGNDSSGSDKDSDGSNLGEVDEAVLSHLEAAKEFFTTGEPFRVYQHSLRQFLKPKIRPDVPESTLTTSRNTIVADDAFSTSDQGGPSSDSNSNQLPGTSSPADKESPSLSSCLKMSDSNCDWNAQTEDLNNHWSHYQASNFSDIDEIEMETFDSETKPPSHDLGGPASPSSVNSAQAGHPTASRSLPYPGITRLYARFMTFLCTLGLREDEIAAGYKRLRWRNGAGKWLYDDYMEHEEGALHALQHRLNSSIYRSAASSTNNRGHGLPTCVPSGSTRPANRSAAASITNSCDIADQNPGAGVNLGSSASRNDLEKGKASLNTLRILSCLDSRRHSVVLHEELVTDVADDQQLFKALRNRYYEHRGKLKRHWSLRTVQAIHFMKFSYGGHRYIDIRCHHEICEHGKPCICLPPLDRVKPKGSEYECTPVPSKLSPPIGPRLLMDFFTNPENINPDSVMYTDIKELWGIYYKEDWDWPKIWAILGLGFFPPSLSFAILWGILQKDIQGAFGVASWWMAGATIVVGLVGTSTWTGQ